VSVRFLFLPPWRPWRGLAVPLAWPLALVSWAGAVSLWPGVPAGLPGAALPRLGGPVWLASPGCSPDSPVLV
jgi:hypothetical protein